MPISSLNRKLVRDLAGIRGVVPLTWPNGGGDPKPDDERFWSAIEEMRLPVNLHIGFGEAGGADPDLPRDPDIMARLQSMPVINRERTASSMMPILSAARTRVTLVTACLAR